MDKTVDQLYTDVIEFVKEATGLTLVIRGDENGPQPKGEYASLLLISQDQVGMDAIVYSKIETAEEAFGFFGNPLSTPFNTEPFAPDDPVVSDEVNVLVSGDIHFTFSFQIFRGTEPMERARKAFRFAQSPWGADWFTSKALVLQSISTPTSTNYEVGSEWIKRSSQQLILAASSEETRTVGFIKEVDVVVNRSETHNVTA